MVADTCCSRSYLQNWDTFSRSCHEWVGGMYSITKCIPCRAPRKSIFLAWLLWPLPRKWSWSQFQKMTGAQSEDSKLGWSNQHSHSQTRSRRNSNTRPRWWGFECICQLSNPRLSMCNPCCPRSVWLRQIVMHEQGTCDLWQSAAGLRFPCSKCGWCGRTTHWWGDIETGPMQ